LPELEPSSCKVSDIIKQAWTIVAKNYNLKNSVKNFFLILLLFGGALNLVKAVQKACFFG
jgi:hypothetical protein